MCHLLTFPILAFICAAERLGLFKFWYSFTPILGAPLHGSILTTLFLESWYPVPLILTLDHLVAGNPMRLDDELFLSIVFMHQSSWVSNMSELKWSLLVYTHYLWTFEKYARIPSSRFKRRLILRWLKQSILLTNHGVNIFSKKYWAWCVVWHSFFVMTWMKKDIYNF